MQCEVLFEGTPSEGLAKGLTSRGEASFTSLPGTSCQTSTPCSMQIRLHLD